MEAATPENLLEITFAGQDAMFFKARPVEEGGKRSVYVEASNEAGDQENQRILKSALMEQRENFLANGNIDIDHMTIVGHRLGKPNPHIYEIGLPVEVKEGPGGVFVKGSIYQGGPSAGPEFGGVSAADWWWATQLSDPPMKWRPSVAGPLPPGSLKTVCKNGVCHQVITKCVWLNLGFAKGQQNLALPAVSRIPFGEFAKAVILAETNSCDGGEHCSCSVQKALTAGYGTDVAGLGGGQALQRQSIDRRPLGIYGTATTRYMKALHTGACDHTMPGMLPSIALLQDHFERCEGLDKMTARRSALRFANDIRNRSEQSKAAA
jgi:hypothetical protein